MDNNWNFTTLGNGLPVNSSLSQQDPIYSWTVDQFQHNLGKDCGTMNMNDLVKNISSAQETQGMVSEGLKRQGSITLPRLLSQKTVDEVWKYITEEEHTNGHGGGTHIPQIQSQQTLGDITLQEFNGNNNYSGYIHDTSVGVQYQQTEMVSALMNNMHDSNLHQNVNGNMSTYQTQQPIMSKPNGYDYGTQIGYSNGFMTIGEQSLQKKNTSFVPNVATISGGGMTCLSMTPFPILDGIQKINGDSSSLISPSSYIFSGSNSVRCRKNNNSIAAENKLDKKRRRKIKNRESAARSRARKQAQIMELEVELEELKKQNQELKLQAEMMKRQTKPVKGIINLLGQPETKLRRTKSDIN